MTDKCPQLNPNVDWAQAKLTPEEGFVLSRIDGRTTVRELIALTRFSPERLGEILQRLLSSGCLLAEPKEATDPPPLDEAALEAECRKADPAIFHRWVERGELGAAQIRAWAAHHPSSAGLDALCSKPALLQDEVVQHHLLRNANLTEGAFRKAFAQKPLVYFLRLTTSKDITERTRRYATSQMRTRFANADAEEQVSAIIQSEGRILQHITGVVLSPKAAAILCNRPITSTMLLQNFARWPATPPNVMVHLLRQAILKSQPELRRFLQRHPNAPKEKH